MSADGNEDYGILSVPDERVMTSLPALPLPLLCSASAYIQLSLPNHIPNIVRKAYPLPKSMITPRSYVSLIQYYNAVFSNNRDAVKTSTRISAII